MSIPARLLIALVFGIALAVGGFFFGVDFEQGNTAKRDLTLAVGREHALLEDIETGRRINAGISLKLASTMAKAETDRVTFERKLRETPRTELVQVDCPVAGSGIAMASVGGNGLRLAPAVRLSRTFVGLWDDASAIGLPEAYGSWRVDAAAGAPDSVEVDEILANYGENSRACNGLRAQVLGWQEWARANKLTGDQ